MNFENEISFITSRSSGPGGQNVNKVNTRVTLKFDINNSNQLSSYQKMIIHEKLKNRINQEGFLIISSDQSRSQLRNKELALDLLNLLIAEALKPIKKRKPTNPSKSSKLKRLQKKKLASDKKRNRMKPEL